VRTIARVLATFVLRLVRRSLDDGDVVGVAEHVDCGQAHVVRNGEDLLAYLREHEHVDGGPRDLAVIEGGRQER
jgi:hypothetical protein